MSAPTAEELVDEIMERARVLCRAHCSRVELAEIDEEQFDVGATFATGAAMLVLREHDLLKSPTP